MKPEPLAALLEQKASSKTSNTLPATPLTPPQWHLALRPRYDQVRRQAKSLGFEYVDNAYLLQQSAGARLIRFETLVAKGPADDPVARAAALGTEKRPKLKLARLFEEYEQATRDDASERLKARLVACGS